MLDYTGFRVCCRLADSAAPCPGMRTHPVTTDLGQLQGVVVRLSRLNLIWGLKWKKCNIIIWIPTSSPHSSKATGRVFNQSRVKVSGRDCAETTPLTMSGTAVCHIIS